MALMVGGNPREQFLGVPHDFSCKHASQNGLARFSQGGGVQGGAEGGVWGVPFRGFGRRVFEVPFCFFCRRNPTTTPKQELVPLLGLPSMRLQDGVRFKGHIGLPLEWCCHQLSSKLNHHTHHESGL